MGQSHFEVTVISRSRSFQGQGCVKVILKSQSFQGHLKVKVILRSRSFQGQGHFKVPDPKRYLLYMIFLDLLPAHHHHPLPHEPLVDHAASPMVKQQHY